MWENTLQANQYGINNVFLPLNDLFESFKETTADWIIQMTDFVNPLIENIFKL